MKRRMIQNQYYPQIPNNNYVMPQYQNYQMQQPTRQDQLNQVFNNTYTYTFVQNRGEAERWPVAPGSLLVFADQNGMYYYTKSLSFTPNDKPVFSVFKREDCVESVNNNPNSQIDQNPLKEELDKYQNSTKLEMDNLRSSLNELKDLITQNSKPNFNSKKGGNRQ